MSVICSLLSLSYLEKLWDVKYYGKNYDETHIDFKSARTEIVAAKLGH